MVPVWACPRRTQRGGWHRLRRCSRLKPLPQVLHKPEAWAVPVGAGSPAKNPAWWMAPAKPVFAAVRRSDTPAPTVIAQTFRF
ncbi:hypothetical protein B8W72_24510 [Pseudomonas putida]|uniref:Uncharacterized protein n=1 Tax=Pseudomonas putida TaxID=303 RepID=A0A1Y3KKK5_PSEPU|nr:hypothetical protein B8W72_24510 [Pseudomonas putida]